ncbi:T9SS type A sorting domain-containing protein [Winogradskyella sp. PG-2]|uniref:T9SS type A sorting domain-containing protein n=1 Tax=Winogradskyella sp. PG-2 TaxID=754409 RepID=UPI0004588C8F|nr:T9SS type A sorting domain-containing protein [Winogradskyella sp. PG-2]BAO77447.1 hypothetical protein WPG_3217 [Winogradskyella sp. PG-2]
MYTVSVYDDLGNFDEDSVTVIVNPNPIADLGIDQTICQGETITLTADGGTSYLWSTGEITDSIEVSPIVETTYDVEVISNGCSSTDSITVFVNEAPNITVSDDIVIVIGDSTTLAVNGSDNYLWSTGETTAFINVNPTDTTTYTVSSLGATGCTTILEVTVIVIPEVIADAGSDTTICRDEIVTLAASGGGTYLWNTGETTAELVVSPLVTTTYTVTVEDDYGYADTDSVTITVNETPDITVSNDVVIVEGESTTLIASGGDNYLWNTGDSTASLIVSPMVTTTYSVISVADGGCADIEQVTVTVIPEVIAYAGEDITICSGEIVTLTATGGGTYLWNTGETVSQFDVVPLITTTYDVTVEDDYGYTDTDSITITVNQTLDITVSNDIMIIDGESTTLVASGGDNYQWSTSETTASIIVSPTITTTYSVTSLGASGCNDTEQITVTVIPEVIAYAGEDITICSGEIVTLNATGGGTYLWNSGDTTSQIEVTPLTTTTYIITVEDDYGNTDTDSVTITVNQTPSITVNDDVTIMNGQSATLNVSGSDNYEWSTGETTETIVVSPTDTTTYTVLSLGEGGCNDLEEVTVTVVPELIANAGADQEICNGESITLSASGGIIYTWNTGETSQQILVSPTVTTTYIVVAEDGFGNSDTDSVKITVNEVPNVTASDDIIIMDGESTTISAIGGNNYQWDTGETSASITVSPSATTIYTVSTIGVGGCEDTDQVTVTVIPELIANAGDDVTICRGDSVILNATGGETYLWNTGETTSQIEVSPIITTTYTITVENALGYTDTDDVTITVNETPNVTVSQNITITEGESTSLVANGAETYIWNNGSTFSTIVVSPTQTTTYMVIGTSANSCTAEAQVTVTVEEPFFASAGQDERVCSDDIYEVTLTATQGDSYLWSTGETTQTIVVSPLSTTTYIVTVTQGAQEDTDDVTVYVDPNPEVVIINGDSVDIMNGDFITLSAIGANTYEWNNGATQPNIAVSPSTTTTYEVKGYVGDCYDEKQVTVNVIPSVEADAGEDVVICLDEVATLTATGGDEYEWSTGETTQTIQVSPTVTTQYTVTVFNALDFDEDSIIVEVDTDCEDDEDDEEDDEEEVPNTDDPLDFDFKIFPNPASDIVNVKLSGSINLTKIYLYDITGKLIYKSRVSNENLGMSSTTEIDVSKLLPGIYYIKMVDIYKEISEKLIIQ